MRLLFLLISHVFCVHMIQGKADNDEEDYEYDEEAENRVDIAKGGTRLVGASRGDSTRLTFLVGFKIDANENHHSTCTGSLISPQWVISAAHCILDIVGTNFLKKCAALTKRGRTFTYLRNTVKCTFFKNGNIKIDIIQPEGVAYLGVADINKFEERVFGESVKIDFVVRHAQSYQGGGYHSYGGYDISLIHLEKPAPVKYKPACLPGPNQKDNSIGPGYNQEEQANLAGYGRYYRTPCMTDQFGPAKFHYCENPKSCSESVPKLHPECHKFFADPTTPDKVPVDDEDLIIVSRKGRRISAIHCHQLVSPLKDSKGWCKVTKDASDLSIGLHSKRAKKDMWGFCSKDCYLERKPHEDHSVLRKLKNVDILDDKLCQVFLNLSLPTSTVEVYPQILCVGFVKPLKYSVWSKTSSGHYKEVPHDAIKGLHRLKFITGQDIYVHSAGTCQGDSGGPVFSMNELDKSFVVLGAVSGGRGALGHCGGLNNPTHYARISFFLDWIGKILGNDIQDVCYGNGDKSISYQQYKNL